MHTHTRTANVLNIYIEATERWSESSKKEEVHNRNERKNRVFYAEGRFREPNNSGSWQPHTATPYLFIGFTSDTKLANSYIRTHKQHPVVRLAVIAHWLLGHRPREREREKKCHKHSHTHARECIAHHWKIRSDLEKRFTVSQFSYPHVYIFYLNLDDGRSVHASNNLIQRVRIWLRKQRTQTR